MALEWCEKASPEDGQPGWEETRGNGNNEEKEWKESEDPWEIHKEMQGVVVDELETWLIFTHSQTHTPASTRTGTIL